MEKLGKQKFYSFYRGVEMVDLFNAYLDRGERPIVIGMEEFRISEILQKCRPEQWQRRFDEWYRYEFEQRSNVMWRFAEYTNKEVYVPDNGWVSLARFAGEGGE